MGPGCEIVTIDGLQGILSSVATDTKNAVNNLLGVQSNYFKAQIEIELNGRKRQFSSELVRKDQAVYVAYRSMAPF